MPIITANRQRGESYAGFLVASIAIVPLFLGIPVVGTYLDMKHKAIEANRYSLWERTIWSAPGGSWNDGENSKSEQDIFNEIDSRILSHPRKPMAKVEKSEDPVWHMLNKPFPKNQDNGQRVKVSDTPSKHPDVRSGAYNVTQAGVDAFAHDGIPGLGQIHSKIKSFNSSLPNAVKPCPDDIIGVDFSDGMGLGSKNYVRSSINLRMEDNTDVADRPKTGQKLETEENGAILTNTWTPPTEGKFYERVDRLVFNEFVGCVAVPGALTFGQFAYIPKYGPIIVGEGRIANGGKFGDPLPQGDILNATVHSTRLLPEYVE